MDNQKSHNFLAWAVCVAGWLICAGFCLLLSVELEAYPYAYDVLFPAVVLILFCNIGVFLFIASRWGNNTKRLFGSVLRVCIGEGLILCALYALGKYALG